MTAALRFVDEIARPTLIPEKPKPDTAWRRRARAWFRRSRVRVTTLPYVEPTWRTPWMSNGAHDNSAVTKFATLWPLPELPSKKYRPIDVDFLGLSGTAIRKLPAELADVGKALSAVSDALDASHVIGSDHFSDVNGHSVARRLTALNRTYKAWRRGRVTAAALIEEADAVRDLIDRAPVPVAATERTPNAYTAEERARVPELVSEAMATTRPPYLLSDSDLRAEIEDRTCRAMCEEDFETTDNLEAKVRKAHWRAVDRVKARREWEVLTKAPRFSMAGRKTTRLEKST